MDEKLKKDVQEIQLWTQEQRFLAKNLSSAFILTFLLSCKNKEKAKHVLQNYFSARQSTPEIFTKTDPLLPENIEVWKSSCFFPLMKRQGDSLIFLGATLSSKSYDFVKFVKQMFMCIDFLIKNGVWGCGDHIMIFSYGGFQMENLSSITMYAARKTVDCLRAHCLPGTIKAVHNVHIPPFISKIFHRFKPYLRQEEEDKASKGGGQGKGQQIQLLIDSIKISNVLTNYNLYFHKNLRSLHRYIDSEILPLEFGGSSECLSRMIEKWCHVLAKNQSFFVEEEQKQMEVGKIKK